VVPFEMTTMNRIHATRTPSTYKKGAVVQLCPHGTYIVSMMYHNIWYVACDDDDLHTCTLFCTIPYNTSDSPPSRENFNQPRPTWASLCLYIVCCLLPHIVFIQPLSPSLALTLRHASSFQRALILSLLWCNK